MKASPLLIFTIYCFLFLKSQALEDKCGVDCSSFRSDSNLYSCLFTHFAPGQLVLPGVSSGEAYTTARTMWSGRTALPAAVVYATSTEDVAAAVECSWRFGFSVSAAGGRHSFQGWSVVSGSVTIDTSQICSDPLIDAEKLTIRIGAGCTNAILLAAVTVSGIPGAMSVLGSCPSVGLVGYILGGGQGDISPYVGLGCDQVLELKAVLYNGTVITANREDHQDFLWSSCGGGPGLGVITEMLLKIHIAPDPNRFTYLGFGYPLGSKALQGIVSLQKFLTNDGNTNNRKYGGGASLSSTSFSAGLVYLGGWQDAIAGLKDAGLLNTNLLSQLPRKYESVQLQVNFVTQASNNAGLFPGVLVREFPSYAYVEAFQICSYLLSSSNTAVFCPSLSLDCIKPPPFICDDKNTLDAVLLQAGNRSSELNVAISPLWTTPGVQYLTMSTGGLMIREMPTQGWDEVVKYISSSLRTPIDYCLMRLGLNHFTHGAVGDVQWNATAYPWRKETLLLDYGSYIAVDPHGAVACHDWTTALTNILYKYIQPKGYINYMGAPQEKWSHFYFGDNYPRLKNIKACYDPLDVFGKPFTVETGGTCGHIEMSPPQECTESPGEDGDGKKSKGAAVTTSLLGITRNFVLPLLLI